MYLFHNLYFLRFLARVLRSNGMEKRFCLVCTIFFGTQSFSVSSHFSMNVTHCALTSSWLLYSMLAQSNYVEESLSEECWLVSTNGGSILGLGSKVWQHGMWAIVRGAPRPLASGLRCAVFCAVDRLGMSPLLAASTHLVPMRAVLWTWPISATTMGCVSTPWASSLKKSTQECRAFLVLLLGVVGSHLGWWFTVMCWA